MRYQYRVKSIFCAVVMSVIAMFAIPFYASAQDNGVSLSQTILPVRMVYFGDSGEVERVWGNVSPYDIAYVVKGVTPQGKEIVLDSSLIQSIVLENRTLFSSFENDASLIGVNTSFAQTPFVQDTRFFSHNGTFEEVRTVL